MLFLLYNIANVSKITFGCGINCRRLEQLKSQQVLEDEVQTTNKIKSPWALKSCTLLEMTEALFISSVFALLHTLPR